MVACRRCVGDRACGRGYRALGVHLRLPSRERGHQASIRTAATAGINVARAALRESVPAIVGTVRGRGLNVGGRSRRSEEHTSELQSQSNLVCRLLLEKKKNTEQ